MHAKRELREKARELRKQGKSVRAIMSELGVSKSSVSIWVRDIELTEEQKAKLKVASPRWGAQHKGGHSNRQHYLENRKRYQEEGSLRAQSGSRLHLAGCMLYWAEGGKTQRNVVHFSNSDPDMMRLFIQFLREEFPIEDRWFRLQIHCHTHDPEEQKRILRYWLDVLQLPDECVQNIQVKKGSDTRRNRLENGVCALQLFRTEIAQHIFGAIQEYGGFENPAWLG